MRLEVVGRLKIFSSVMGNWFIFISTLKQHEVYSTFPILIPFLQPRVKSIGEFKYICTHCKAYLFKNAQLKLAEYTDEMD